MSKLIEKDPVHLVEEDNITPPPHYDEEGPPQVITSDTARQGPRGTPVLAVLVIGLIAIGIVWVIVHWFVY